MPFCRPLPSRRTGPFAVSHLASPLYLVDETIVKGMYSSLLLTPDHYGLSNDIKWIGHNLNMRSRLQLELQRTFIFKAIADSEVRLYSSSSSDFHCHESCQWSIRS